jgi:hypothetical protein
MYRSYSGSVELDPVQWRGVMALCISLPVVTLYTPNLIPTARSIHSAACPFHWIAPSSIPQELDIWLYHLVVVKHMTVQVTRPL